MENIEKKFETPKEKFIPKIEEEKDNYNLLREELREMKKGGVDIHFSRIDEENLSKETLDLYEKYKESKLTEEEVKNFAQKIPKESPDYQFAAMLLNWVIGKREELSRAEKELLKEEAKSKLEKLKKINPDIEKYLQGINLDDLLKTDYKIITDLNKQNFESYEKLLRAYFWTKVESKVEERSKETKLRMIQNDPRFQYYCLLREAMNLGGCNPETFL